LVALEDLQQQQQQRARLTLVKEPMLIPRESGRSHLSGTAHTVRTSEQAQRSKAALRRVNVKEGETRGCSGQRKAKLKPVVVEPVASEQQRNQADLRQRVTQEQQEVSTWGPRNFIFCFLLFLHMSHMQSTRRSRTKCWCDM
jgi:hypothetical protein